jgi:hypothetical protein
VAEDYIRCGKCGAVANKISCSENDRNIIICSYKCRDCGEITKESYKKNILSDKFR